MSDPEQFLDAVSLHAGTALERCRDRWGPATGLLADGFDIGSHEPGRWESAIVSDLSCQQNLIRCLDGLVQLSGEDLWEQVAEDWIGHAVPKLTDEASDLWYWGGHTAFDLETDQVLRGNHELKCVFPCYDYLYRIHPEATRRFIDAFWHAHVWDWSSLLFNRHGEYEPWDRNSRWQHTFGGTETLPIIENKALSFINTGADLVYAATEAHRLTGEAAPLEWALHLLSCYQALRHPDTDLGGYQFNHRDPCRVRQSFLGDLGERSDVNETTVLTNGVITTRYGRVAITLLNQAMALGDSGAPLVEFVSRDLRALATHSWQPGAGIFQALLNDGTLLTPEHTRDVGYCQPFKLAPVRANGLMLLAYARGYRVTGDDSLLDIVHQIASAMGWPSLLRGPVDFSASLGLHDPSQPHPGQQDACALEALLDLYIATTDEDLLLSAVSLGQRLVATHLSEGLFTSSTACLDSHTDIDSAVPVALLRLIHAMSASVSDRPTPPVFYPNSTVFDPKVVVARR